MTGKWQRVVMKPDTRLRTRVFGLAGKSPRSQGSADAARLSAAGADAVRAHPTDEHLLPLFVALGAGGDSPAVRRLHAGIDDYVIAMDAYEFSNNQGVLQ